MATGSQGIEERLRSVRDVVEQLLKPDRLAELLVARLVAVGADPLVVDEARRLLRHIQEALTAAMH